jgi:hypothetical protein
MSFSDNLAVFGVFLAFGGIAVTILWPTQRWIGWLCLAAAFVVLAIWGWRVRHYEPPQQSRLEISNIVGVPAQNKDTQRKGFFLNMFYANKGTTSAKNMAHRSIVLYSDHLLSSEEEEPYKKQALEITADKSEEEIPPGIPPNRYFSVPQDDSEAERMGVEAEDVLAGKKRLYLFVVMKYRDDEAVGGPVRITEFCGWFLGTFEVWHNCGDRFYSSPE